MIYVIFIDHPEVKESFICSIMQQITQELEQDEVRSFRHQVGSPVGNSPPSK
jgi:hypothetical protein